MCSSRRAVALIVLAFLASVSCAEGVTWININGQTDADIEAGQPICIAMDCTPGGEVIWSPFVDTNGSGAYDSADQPLGDPTLYVDNTPRDEDPRDGYVQQTESANVGLLVGKPILLVATEVGSGTTVSCRCVFHPAETAQGFRGHLSNSDATAAPGQTVWAADPRNAELDDPTDTPRLYAAITDQNGDFEICVPGAGCYLLGAGEGDAAWRPAYVTQGAFVEGIELRLPTAQSECPGGRYLFSGTVTDAQNTPIPFTRITAHDNYWSWDEDFFCDLQGNFSVALPAGNLGLDVRLNGYLQDDEYSLNLTDDTTLDIKVHRAPYYVTGIARDSVTSQPVADGWIEVSADSAPHARGSDGTSMSGRFLCWSDAGALHLRSDIWAGGYERFEDTLTISGNTTHDIAFTPMTAIVHGRVNDDRGQDVPYVYVEALNQTRPDAARASTLANADGTYSIGLTPGDTYDIRFLRPGWGSQTYTGLTAVSGDFALDRTLNFISDAPVMSGGGVNPTSGDSNTTYTFEVVYTDPNNDPPGSVWVFIDDISYEMTPAELTDTTYTDGARYVYSTQLCGGGHQYRFSAEDSHGAPSHAAQGEPNVHRGPCVDTVTPANDNCADAIALAPPAWWTTDLSGATSDAGETSECSGDVYHTVWYSYLATETGPVDVTAVARNHQWNALLDIFEGQCGGLCWEALSMEDGPNLRSIHVLEADPEGWVTIGWAVGDGGYITSPIGEPESGTTNDLFSVYGLDANLVWTAGAGGTILHSTDGGETWSPQTSGVTSTLRSAKFKDQNDGLAVGDGGVILGTNNGGTSWMSMTSGTAANLNDFTGMPPGYDVLFVVGDSGTLLKTATNVWSPVSVPTTANLRGISFGSSESAWIVGDGGVILHSSDGGDTWTGQTSGVETNLYSVQATGALECRAVGAGGVILHTEDGGLNWTQEAFESTEDLYSLSMIGSQLGMACGANGTFALLKACGSERVTCGYESASFVAEAGVRYLLRIGSGSAQAGLVDCTFTVPSSETPLTVSPDPFTPTGCNSATITLLSDPNLYGGLVRVCPADRMWEEEVALNEMPVGSGIYVGHWYAGRRNVWDGRRDIDFLAPDSDAMTVEVITMPHGYEEPPPPPLAPGPMSTPPLVATETPEPITFAVHGIASVTASGDMFDPLADETITITAETNADQPVAGLHLQAQVENSLGEVVRSLQVEEDPAGTYSCTWDGRDDVGVVQDSGQYFAYFTNTDCEPRWRYYPSAVVSVGVAVSAIEVSPNPFTPTGSDTARITVTATPGLSGLQARIHHPEWASGELGGLTMSMDNDVFVDLVETAPDSGTYTADWDGTEDGVLAAGCESVTVHVAGGYGDVSDLEAGLVVRGVTRVSVSPATLPRFAGDETATITAMTNASDPVSGLPLSAQIWRVWEGVEGVIRAIPMSEGPAGVYTCAWDGRDDAGVPLRPSEYGIIVTNTAWSPAIPYWRISSASIGLRGAGSGPATFLGIVTGKFDDAFAIPPEEPCMFVESEDRSVGVKIAESPESVNVGDEVVVVGEISVVDGMKQIAPTQTINVRSTDNPMPYLGMRLHDVGGKDYDPVTDPGITDGRGPLNVGLLVNVSGMVTYRDTAASPEFFYIWDGSNMVTPGGFPEPLCDGTLTRLITQNPNGTTRLGASGDPEAIEVPVLGLKIADGGHLGAQGRGVIPWQDWVDIEGIVSVEQAGTKTIPVILPKTVTLRTEFEEIKAGTDEVVSILGETDANAMSLPAIPAKTGNGTDYQYYSWDWSEIGYDLNPMIWEPQMVFGKERWQVNTCLKRTEAALTSEFPYWDSQEPLGIFGGMLLGDGYWVRPNTLWGETAIEYSGIDQGIPQWIGTVKAGWTQIGTPQSRDCRISYWDDNGTPENWDDDFVIWDAEVYLSDGAVVHNVEEASVRGLDWVNSLGWWLDNKAKNQWTIGTDEDVPYTTKMTPWASYFFQMHQTDKAFIIYPGPGGVAGGDEPPPSPL